MSCERLGARVGRTVLDTPCAGARAPGRRRCRTSALLACLAATWLGSSVAAASPQVIATIPVGDTPVFVSVNPALHRAYVTNHLSHTLSVIDTSTNTVVTTVPVGTRPVYPAIDPDTNKVYIAHHHSHDVRVLNGNTNSVEAVFPSGGFLPEGTAVNTQTNRLYVANAANPGPVAVFDTIDNSQVATIPTADGAVFLALDPGAQRAYLTNFNTNQVYLINTATNSVITTIAVGSAPIGITVNPQTSRAYVANRASDSVTVIDTDNNTVVATIPVGPGPSEVALNKAANRAYVTNTSSNTIQVIDTTANTVIDTVTVGAGPFGVAFDPQTGRIYTANSGDNTVTVLSGPGDQIGDTIDLLASYGLDHGTENSLRAKLRAALDALAAGDTGAACNTLNAFRNEVAAQRGKKLTAAQADELTDAVEQIRAALGC